QVGVAEYDASLRYDNVRTTGNQLFAYAHGITYHHVDGGSITGNIITVLQKPETKPEWFCGYPRELIYVRDSTDVTVSDNAVQ
ncbi:MAG TPA: hypothetical protein VGW38_00540, partial [Chloroflexota bacterium]|nr:hypothetical protein [Chloroflexota bacterium]